jgi:hypothetical protein
VSQDICKIIFFHFVLYAVSSFFEWHKEKVGNPIAGSDTFQIKTENIKIKFVFQQMRHQDKWIWIETVGLFIS